MATISNRGQCTACKSSHIDVCWYHILEHNERPKVYGYREPVNAVFNWDAKSKVDWQKLVKERTAEREARL